ncbi:MYB DNA-binding domain-containing protein [Seiridium cupressi]
MGKSPKGVPKFLLSSTPAPPRSSGVCVDADFYGAPRELLSLGSTTAPDSNESSVSPAPQHNHPASAPPPAVATTTAAAPAGPPLYAAPTTRLGPTPGPPSLVFSGKRRMAPHASESPAKKQTKWSPDEDALIIELRGSGMKWEDISKRLTGRSSISCRLHYQNYLEKRSVWDDEKKTKLARLYDRLKPEMWAKVADEMGIPWRAVEAMHWQLGEQEMARRAGVVPFSLNATLAENSQHQQQGHARPSPRGHAHSRSQGSMFRDAIDPSWAYGRNVVPTLPPGPPPGRPLGPVPPRKSPGASPHMPIHFEHGESPAYSHSGGPLAPIQSQSSQSRPGVLPGLAELTTGVSPYSTPAYSIGVPTVSPAQSTTASPGPFLPAMAYPPLEPAGSKRRRSPDLGSQDPNRRRHLDSSLEQAIPRHMP